MKTAVTLCEVEEAAAGPFVYHGCIFDNMPRAALQGFDAVELFLPQAAPASIAKIREQAANHGLSIAAVGTGAGMVKHGLSLTDPASEIRGKALSFILDFVDFGAAFGAPAILGSMQGKACPQVPISEALLMLGGALDYINERAEASNTIFLYEPLNRYETNLFNRIDDAADFLRANNWNNIKLLADLFHMNIEEADPCGALERNLALVGHIHFADSNRRAIGMGHTDPLPYLAMLHRCGYAGYLSAEILPLPTADEAAMQFIASTRIS